MAFRPSSWAFTILLPPNKVPKAASPVAAPKDVMKPLLELSFSISLFASFSDSLMPDALLVFTELTIKRKVKQKKKITYN